MADTATAEPVSTPSTTPAEPAALPSTGGSQTTESVWDNFDAQMEREAQAAASEAEPPPEHDEPADQVPQAAAPPAEKPKEESRYPLDDEGIEKTPLTRRAREAFAEIKDPRWRKIATDAYWYAEGYRKAGMHLSDIPKYREIAPTLETLQTLDSIAREKVQFDQLITSGAPEAVSTLANQINQLNPKVWSDLVNQLADNLNAVDKQAFYRVGDKITKNIIANMRRDSKLKNDEDLNTAADVISEWMGWGQKSTPDGQAAPQLAPEIEKELVEAREIKRQAQQRQYEEAQAAYQGFLNSTYETAVTEGSAPIVEWANTWGKSLPSDEARAELASRIGNRIMEMLQGSRNVQVTFDRLVKNGDGSEAHRATCAKYLVNQAKALLPQVAPDELAKFRKLLGVAQATQEREKKIAAVTGRRDVGASGAAAAATVPTISGKGKTADQVFAEFEKRQGIA